MSSENCNDHLCYRNKQLFRFLGLKEIKTLNYLTQMLLSWLDRWSTKMLVSFKTRVDKYNESFAPSSLAAGTCSYSCLASNATSVRKRELGLVTFGLAMCGNP